MNTIDTIMTRTSIRKFTDTPVSAEDIRTILKAGMSGPSCVNARDWSFIVVTGREMLNKMADANGRPAAPLRNAAFGYPAEDPAVKAPEWEEDRVHFEKW